MSDKYTDNLIKSGADPVLVGKLLQSPAPQPKPDAEQPAKAAEKPATPRKASKRTRKAD
jgi:hypothetical protein